MQDLDDLAVRGHGAARRRNDDGGGRRSDERQHGETAKRRGAGQRPDLGLPAAVIVERDALEILRQSVADGGDVGRIGAVDLDRDQPRDRQRRERVAAAEPRLEQLGRILGGQRLHSRDPGLLGEKQRDQRHLLLDVGLVDRIELDGDLARDVVDPGIRRLIDHVDRAGGEAGEEGHDGDHHGERVAGDRGRRHDLRRLRLEARRHEAGEKLAPGIVADVGEGLHRRQWISKCPSLQHEARRVEPVHQGVIVGGDDHRGAEPVQLDEETQQAVGDDRIDIAGRLVGEQQFGPCR